MGIDPINSILSGFTSSMHTARVRAEGGNRFAALRHYVNQEALVSPDQSSGGEVIVYVDRVIHWVVGLGTATIIGPPGPLKSHGSHPSQAPLPRGTWASSRF